MQVSLFCEVAKSQLHKIGRCGTASPGNLPDSGCAGLEEMREQRYQNFHQGVVPPCVPARKVLLGKFLRMTRSASSRSWFMPRAS